MAVLKVLEIQFIHPANMGLCIVTAAFPELSCWQAANCRGEQQQLDALFSFPNVCLTVTLVIVYLHEPNRLPFDIMYRAVLLW